MWPSRPRLGLPAVTPMTDPTNPSWVRIAALQPDLHLGQVMPNLHLLRSMVDRAVAEAPLDIVILPEIFDGSYDSTDGAGVRRFLETLARACDVHVIGGSCLITQPDGRRFNACHVVRRGGEEIGRYDKRVLFSTEADGREPGPGPGVFDLDGIRVGVLICADLWHPELAREVHDRIDLLAVPAKTTVPTENYQPYARTMWHAMALTRAMENGVAVAVSDWPESRQDTQRLVGGARTRQTYYTSGATCIADPSHRPDVNRIQRTMARGEPGVLRADIDISALEAYREYRRSVGLLPAGNA